jgi:tetratricopeptide (TPR) repeat protein
VSAANLDEQIRTQLATLEASPADAAALDALSGIYRREGRWEELIRLYESLARRASGPDQAASLLTRAGEAAREGLRSSARAEDLLRQALHAEPGHRAALAALVAVTEERGDGAAAAEALELQAAREAAPRAAAALWLRAGRVWEERLLRRDRAALLYLRALRLDPELAEARERALGCQLALHRYAAAKKILDRGREVGADRRQLAAEYARLGALLLDQPLDHGLAMEALIEALSLDRAAPGAQQALDRVKATPRAWREMARQLLEDAERARERRTAAQLTLRVAELHAAYDPDGSGRAGEFLDRAMGLWPGMSEGLDFLERWLSEKGDWRGLADRLTRLAAITRDRAALCAVQLRLAQVELMRFGDAEKSAAALEKALEQDPQSETAAYQLLEFQLDGGRRVEALATIEKHLAAAQPRPAHAGLRLRAAELARALGDPARARTHLEAARRADPRSPAVAAARAPALAAAGAWRALADALEAQIAASRAPSERARLLEQLAEVQAERLAAPAEALRTLGRALLADPGRAPTRKAIEEIAARHGLTFEVPRIYRTAADAPGAELKARRALLRRAAEILDKELSQPEEAARVWRLVAEADPQDGTAAASLEQALVRAGHQAEVAAEIEKRLAAAVGADRRELVARLARVRQESGEHTGAAEAWREVLLAAPDDLAALRGLADALEPLGAPLGEELLATLLRLSGRLAGAERAEVDLRRARVLDAHSRPGEAAAVLLSSLRAGGLAPAQMGETTRSLESLLERGVDPVRIAQALLPVYAAAGDSARHVGMLELLAERLPAGTEGRERARLLLDAAALRADRLRDPRGALSSAAAALRASPGHAEARLRCERLALEVGAVRELYALLDEAGGRLGPRPDDERAVRLRAAQIAEAELGDPDAATAQLRRALELAPGDPATLAALTRIALAGERWEVACDLLSERAAAADGPERTALLSQLGDTLLERLKSPPAAIDAYRQALAGAAPDQRPRLLARMAGALEQANDPVGQVRALEELAREAPDGAEAHRAALEQARLRIERLADPMGAVQVYRKALERDPADSEARAGLSRLLGGEHPAAAAAAAETLASALEAAGDRFGAAAPLASLVERALEPAARVAAARRLAALHREAGRRPEAFEVLRRALADAPGDAALRRELVSLAERRSEEEAAAAALEQASRALRGSAAAASWRDLAALCETRLGDRERALAASEAALAADPADRDTLQGLRRLARALERWPRLVDACAAAARAASGAAERAEALREAAQVAEARLQDPTQAAGLWSALLSAAPGDAEAQAALERIAAAQGDAGALAAALERRRSRPGGDKDLEAAFQLAELKRTRLGAPGEALSLLTEVLRGDPAHAGARGALVQLAAAPGPVGREALATADALLRALGDHRPRTEARRLRLAAVTEANERVRLWAEIRGIEERELSDPEAAFESAAAAFAEGGEPRAEALDDLVRIAPQARAQDRLARLMEEAAGAAEGEPAAALWRLAARLREQALGDPGGAIEDWKSVRTASPDDAEALEALARLYAGARSAAEQAEVVRRRAELAPEPERPALLVELGRLESEMGRVAPAIAALEEALRLDGRNSPALSLLEPLYERAGRVEDRARVLRELARLHLDDPGMRTDLLLRRAAALEAADPGRAVDAYAEILSEDRREPSAVAGLERLLARPGARGAAARVLEETWRAAGDARGLARVLPVRLEEVSPGEAGPLLAELAQASEILGDRRAAFEARARQLHLAASAGRDDAAARGELERLAGETGMYAELVRAYEMAAPGLAGPPRAELARRIASLCADRLGRLDDAARWLADAAAVAPGAEVLADLARLHRRRGAWRELCEVRRIQAAQAASAEDRKELLTEAAQILEGQLSDREGAAETWRQVLAADPEEPAALRELGRLLAAAERWDEAARLLGQEIAVAAKSPSQVADVAELRHRLGRIQQQRLLDLPGAIASYRAVLAQAPRHPATLQALEEIARSAGPVAAEAAALLEPVYQQEGENQRLCQVLEARALAAPEGGERAALLRRIAALQAGPLKSPEAAFQAAARALREEPDSAETLDLVAGLADQSGRQEALAQLLAEAAERARDPVARVEVRRRLARLASRAGGDPQRAADEWSRVLELAPDDSEALAGLTAIHRQSGNGEQLAQVLRRRTTAEADPTRRAALLAELAQVQEERQRDLAGAMLTLRRLLEIEPGRRDSLARLDRLCVRTEKWAELADVLSREVAAAVAAGDAGAAAVLRYRLADLREGRLLDREGAVALYEEIVADQPDHAEALSRLEGLLQKDPRNARAGAALQRAYAATGAWDRYAAALELQASERPDPAERMQLWLELAQVREDRLGDRELAFLALCRAFRDDPGDPALRRDLARLAAASGHEEELAGLYEEEFERLPSGGDVEVSLALGALFEGKLSDPPRAIHWLERARQLDAARTESALPALERLYRATSRWPELAEVLEALAERAQGEERAGLLFRLGQLREERLGDAERASEAYGRALEVDPRHLPALRAAERLHEAAGRLEPLAQNLTAQRALAQDGPTRLRLAVRLAEVTQALGREADAATLWREVLAQDPRHDGAFAALDGLYEKLARWAELAELLRARLQQPLDRREAARLNDRLGWVLGARLGDSSQAIQSFQAVVESDPRNRRALEALRDIYAAQGALEQLAATYRRLIPLQEDAAGVKAVRLKLAEVLLQGGSRQEAVEQAKRAFDLEPNGEEELARIAGVFEAAGAAPERVRAVEARAQLLAQAGRGAEAVAAWLQSAELWERPLGRPEGAAAALEKVLELEPASRDAFQRLRDLHARTGSWRDYVRVLDQYAPRVPDRAERVALLREMAEVHEKRLGQKELAFLACCRAFQEDPADEGAVQAAQRLAAETEAYDELAAVYEQVAEEAQGGLRGRLFIELGRIRDSKLDDADGAEAAFRRALESDPASPEVLDALTSLFTRRGRVRDLVITLEQKLEAAAGLEEKKAILLEIAKLSDGPLQDPQEAVVSLRRVLELDGGDAPAIELLASIYRREKRHGELAQLLARARDLAPDDVARIGWQLQLAALHENELADDEAAVEDYRSALGLDDRRPEALAGLERLYTKLDRFAELNRVYERQADLAQDPREKVRILGKSASIWEEKLNNIPKAIERQEQILAADGGNLGAAKALEALYRREGAWEKLIAVMSHHLTLVQERREQVQLEVAIGDVWWKELQRVDRAEAMFSHALQMSPDSREAVSALGRLYERSGNWNLALEMLQREVKLAVATPDAVEVYARIGRIQEEMLQDRAAAKEAYGRALDLDPGHLVSLRAMKAIAEAERDRERYLGFLVAEARYAETDAEKAALLAEAGRIHQEERDDPDGAIRLYEEALRRVPDLLAAARPLSELYQSRSAWADAGRVLEVIVARLEAAGEAKELCRQTYRLGYVREKLGLRDKALASYRRAYELDATYLPALEGLGNLLVQGESWEEALRIFQAMLIHHRDGLTDLEVVETYWQIGEIQARLGQQDRAVKSLEKALEIDPNHASSRRSLAVAFEAQGDWEAAVEQRQKLLPLLDGQAKLETLVAIGEACRDRLKDPYQAIDAFLGASRLDPASTPVTEALLALYRETRQGQKAADALQRLLERPEVQADGDRAARLHQLRAQILRDEVKDDAAAAAELERALDKSPRLVQAFADLEEILSRGRKWAELEQAYLRMIQRLPKGPEAAPARVALWKTLGELYRRVLRDPERSRTAWEVVVKGDPDDASALEAYAELSGSSPGHEAEAIDAWRRLVRLGAPPAKAAHALTSLHAARKEFDQAWTAAQVACILAGGGAPEDRQVVERLRRFAREAASQALDEKAWTGRILHERAHGPLPEIMALLVREAGSVFTQATRDLGIERKAEVDLNSSMLFFANMFKYVARTLGLGTPRLFRVEGPAGRLALVPTDPVGMVAAESFFQERPKKELWFAIGKAMTFARPELLLARLMPHDQLEVVFQAACSLGTSRFVVTADSHQVEKVRRQLAKALPPAVQAKALKLLARRYCEVQHPGDVRGYMDACELTSNRVGALLAGDLEVARKGVLGEKAQVSKLREEMRVRDLVQFCLSEDWSALRAHLGLSVVVQA